MKVLPNLYRKIELEHEERQRLFVCPVCLKDEFLRLRAEHQKLRRERPCAICGSPVVKALSSERIAVPLRSELPKHFTVLQGASSNEAMTLEQLIETSMRFGKPEVAKAVAEELVQDNAVAGGFFEAGQRYRRNPDRFATKGEERVAMLEKWRRYAHALVHSRRFFNNEVFDLFDSLLTEALHVQASLGPGERACLRQVRRGSSFYRSRVASDEVEAERFRAEASKELGAPPVLLAASNRMSPAGISLLYVSDRQRTCVSEVRPSIGDLVVVATFMADEDLRFFDFTGLQDTLVFPWLSILDPDHEMRLENRALLRYLPEMIGRPARAGDFDYVMTQAFAEVIRCRKNPRFDGIAFRSVQDEKGINYVVFDKRSLEEMLSEKTSAQFGMSVQTHATHQLRVAEADHLSSP